MGIMNRVAGRVSLQYIVGRLLWGIPVLLTVAIISFLVLRAAPGGPFDREKPLPPAIMENLRRQYALDRPILPLYTCEPTVTPRGDELARFESSYPVARIGSMCITSTLSGASQSQLLQYLGQVIRGDLGVSMKYTELTVNALVARTLPVSLLLGLLAFLASLVMGVGLGLIAAARRGTWIDDAAMLTATAGLSAPSFVTAASLVLVCSLWMKALPPALWEGPAYMILPVLTLAAGPASYLARLTRSGVLDALSQGYIRTARAKGATEGRVLRRHALVNALGPLITVSGPLLAALITGSFIVEHIFAIPGMGRYFITAVLDRDYPTVMGVTLVYAAFVVVANIAVDVLYAVADPRVQP
jgi:oligopeptide transport system permease protein